MRPSFRIRFDLSAPRSLPAELRGNVVALGNFDGVHRGHQALIALALETAEGLGTDLTAVTFEPHPRAFFQPEGAPARILSPAGRARVLGAVGAAHVLELAFNEKLAQLAAEDFIDRVLVDLLGVRAVVVGDGFRFGRGRGGDTDLLREAGSSRSFETHVLPLSTDEGGIAVSSGRIRQSLGEGDIGHANALLGYRWFVRGMVVRGDGRGRELGYPTANLELASALPLRHGIYAVRVRSGSGLAADGVASFGVRPTFAGVDEKLELHLFDFDGDLYGETLEASFVGWQRPELRFNSAEELIAQIDEDARQAKAILGPSGPGSRVDRSLTRSF